MLELLDSMKQVPFDRIEEKKLYIKLTQLYPLCIFRSNIAYINFIKKILGSKFERRNLQSISSDLWPFRRSRFAEEECS